MRRVLFIFTFWIICVLNVIAQSSISFHQLGNETFQNSNLNPVYVPYGKVFFGIPALSGIHLHYNNRFNYDDITYITEAGTKKYTLEGALSAMRRTNMLNLETDISLFHVGFRTRNRMSYTFFGNERINADFVYDRQVMDLLIKGNTSVIDQKVQLGRTRIDATHYREIGVGWTMHPNNTHVIIGGRLKYLMGLENYSTPANQSAYLATNGETFELTAEVENFMLRSSGLDIIQGEEGNLTKHYIWNGNSGAAIDAGFNWRMSDYYSFSASVTDIGFISWKENIKTKYISDSTFAFSGIDIRENENSLVETLKDTLKNQIDLKDGYDPYTTVLSPKLYSSLTYHNPKKKWNGVASFGMRYVHGRVKATYALGYRRPLGKHVLATINVVKLPQQNINMGASLACRFGPVQYYLATDQIINYDATKFQAVDFRTGINFIIGQRDDDLEHSSSSGTLDKLQKKGPKWTIFQSFLGNEVKIKKQEEIYNIIHKQGRRRKKEYNPRKKKKKVHSMPKVRPQRQL